MVKELPLRNEIDDSFKWDVQAIYQTEQDWEDAFEKVSAQLNQVAEYQGKLAVSADNLLTGLQLIMEIQQSVSRLYVYAHLRQDEDTLNQRYQAIFDRAQGLSNQLSSTTSFMVPEILTLTEEKLNEYITTNQGLELYRHLLDNILRQKEHFLSAEEERLLAMVGDVTQGPVNIFSMLNNADLVFPSIKDQSGQEVRVTHGRYIDLLQSNDRRVRKEAFQALYSKYDEHINTFASTLSTNVKSHVFYARARNYNSALEAALDDDNVPLQVYNNLITTVKKNLEPMYRYIALRKRILKLDQIHMYDIYVPLIKEIEMKIPFNQAKEMIINALKPLGNEYLSYLKEGFDSGWIDRYENKGKRSGAYSSGCYGVHPYVLLNYTDNLDNLFTLAHEMGHALHTYYSNQNQPFVYSNYKIFVAEVASTLNEALLNNYLLENTDDINKQRYFINHYLEQFRGTVFRQTMFAEFEKMIHEEAEQGIPLTPENLKEKYRQLNQIYYGPEIVIDDQIDLEWARIPHFYYNFYVYKYATGFSAATALAGKIIKDGAASLTKYLDFLKSGDTDYPINLLKRAGVDMNSPAPIKESIDIFRDFVDRLEELS